MVSENNVGAPYQSHSATSRAAAVATAPRRQTHLARVREYLQRMGEHGATDEEIQQALGMPASTQRPRRIELWQRNQVKNSGRTRLTRSGRKAVVWVWAKAEKEVSK